MFRQLVARNVCGLRTQVLFSSKSRVAQGTIVRCFHAGNVNLKSKNEEPLPPSLVEKFQLDQASRWVPLVAGSFGLASVTGLYHWDAESQMLGLFVLFVGTIYSQGGSAIGQFFDETADAILKEQRAIEDTQIESVRMTLEAHKQQVAIYDDIKAIYEGQKVVMDKLVDASQKRLEHEVRDNFVKKLDTIVNMEQSVNSSVRATLVANATAAVRDQFVSGADDKKLKSDALSNALAAIADPSTQTDAVGDLYTNYFSTFRSKIEKATGQEFDLDAKELEQVNDAIQSVARRDGLQPKPASQKVVFGGF